MLPIEVIGALSLLYIFFMVGTMRAVLAQRSVRRKAKTRPKPKPAGKDLAPEAVKYISHRRGMQTHLARTQKGGRHDATT